MKERKIYLDIAKGLLILVVVLHHLPMVASRIIGITSYEMELLDSVKVLYTPFFMASFFVITGMCTNFEKPFVKFTFQNFKSIMLPAFCLGFINEWLRLIRLGCVDINQYAKLGFHTFFLSGGPFWFLAALFVAKIVYRLYCSVKPDYIRYGFSIFLFFVGVLASEYHVTEYWQVYHAFVLLPFLEIGRLLIRYDIFRLRIIVLVLVYLLSLVILNVTGCGVPSVTQIIDLQIWQIPIYFLLAILGTTILLSISKKIGTNFVLEFYGVNSIVVYGIHLSVLAIFLELTKELYSQHILLSILSIALVYIATLLSLVFFIKLLNKPYFCYFLGRF